MTCIDIIPSTPLKGNSQPPGGDWLDKINQQKSDFNTQTDFWHYGMGVNVIPVDSKNKRPNVTGWKHWQDSPITDKQHEDWKKAESYKNGIAVIAGKIWNGPNKDRYLVGMRFVKYKKGIDEFMVQCFHVKTLEEALAKNNGRAAP